jgi:hypothetical protein
MSNEELIVVLNKIKKDYMDYRGAAFDEHGNLLWAKDDVLSWVEGINTAIRIIKEDNKELLERLGSDYDEEGIPYWDRYDGLDS